MRGPGVLAVVVGGLVAGGAASRDARAESPAGDEPIGTTAITGTVTAVHSRWVSDGSRIVTDATIQTDAGPVTVSQLGGSIDGVGMISMPGPPILMVGMMAQVTAHRAFDRAGTAHVAVDTAVMVGALPDYVRTGPTIGGHYLYWESGCIFVTPDADGTKEIAGSGEFGIIDASIATWNTDTHVTSCSYIQVIENPPQSLEVGNDKINLIKFRDTSWCRPAVDNDPARCYADSAAGITTATYVDDATNSRDGAIVDADIEVNGVDFAIAVDGVSLGTAQCQAELQNTMTHELGHVHGLEHTCLAPGDPQRIDNNGSAVPSCDGETDPAIINATMYNYQNCGETKKELLDPDTEQAICDVYPTAKDPMTCTPVSSASGGCCDTSGAGDTPGSGAGALALGAGVIALVIRRRRH